MDINANAFLKMTYGLYLVCAKRDNEVNGYVSNGITQVTADPEQFAIACNHDNHTSDMIDDSGFFTISVLFQDLDPKMIGTFGFKTGAEEDKFENFGYKTTRNGTPYPDQDIIAWFECQVVSKMDVGTHMLFIGKVVDGKLMDDEGEPLTYAYYRKKKKGLAPKNAPTYIDPKKIKGEGEEKDHYICPNCGYEYDPAKGDPESGIAPGTAFEDLPDDWICPVCGTPKSDFNPKEE